MSLVKYQVLFLFLLIALCYLIQPVISQVSTEVDWSGAKCSEHPCNGHENQGGCVEGYYEVGDCCCVETCKPGTNGGCESRGEDCIKPDGSISSCQPLVDAMNTCACGYSGH